MKIIIHLNVKGILVIVITVLLLLSIIILFLNSNGLHKKNFVSENGIEGDYLIQQAADSEGILLWLHGDGAYEFKHPYSKEYLGGKNGIKAVAEEKNLTLIVPHTPSADTWWENGEDNAEYLIELISTFPEHQKVWISGFSGGAEITTYWLIEKLKRTDIKSGGVILFGGGGSPAAEGITDSLRKEDVIDGSFPITWFIGEKDTGDSNDENPFNALAASKQGERFYRDQGWKTERIILKNYGHLLSENNIGMYGQLLDEIIP